MTWLTTRDSTKYGTRHQSYSPLDDRVTHSLSNLEFGLRIIAERAPGVKGTKEQRVVPLFDTLRAADKLGYPHPSVRGCPNVVTTDLSMLFESGWPDDEVGFAVKPFKKLKDPRVCEKLLIEREVWVSVWGKRWFPVTEHDLPPTLVANVNWVRGRLRPGIMDYIPQERKAAAEQWLRERHHQQRETLARLAAKCDTHFGFNDGVSLSLVRFFIGSRIWECDLISHLIIPSITPLPSITMGVAVLRR